MVSCVHEQLCQQEAQRVCPISDNARYAAERLSRQCQISQCLLYNGSDFIIRLAQNGVYATKQDRVVFFRQSLPVRRIKPRQERSRSKTEQQQQQQQCAGIFAKSQQCGKAVFHKNINSFVGMQQMFLSTFSAVIDYSVDIFCFYGRSLFHRSAVQKNKDTLPAKHNPLLGVTTAQGKAAYCTDCEVV